MMDYTAHGLAWVIVLEMAKNGCNNFTSEVIFDFDYAIGFVIAKATLHAARYVMVDDDWKENTEWQHQAMSESSMSGECLWKMLYAVFTLGLWSWSVPSRVIVPLYESSEQYWLLSKLKTPLPFSLPHGIKISNFDSFSQDTKWHLPQSIVREWECKTVSFPLLYVHSYNMWHKIVNIHLHKPDRSYQDVFFKIIFYVQDNSLIED